MSPTDKFITGEYYYYYFYVTIDEKYTTDSNTKITLNGERVWNYSGNKYYASLQPPYTVTVIGGTAYADNAYTTPVTDAFRYGRVYIKADPTPEGKVFIGWQVTNGSLYWYDTLSKENIIIEISSRDVELTALYADVFTITYTDGVDGEEIFADQVTDGQREGWTTPKFSGTPKRTGYTFAGWSPEVADKVTASVTYTALWTVNQYTITYTSEGNTIKTVTYDYGATVTAPETPTRTGYTFTGWDKTIPETMPSSNLTIAATWQVNQYTITFNTEGGSAVTAITKNYGSSITAPSAPTREGYDFAGWDKEIPSTMPAENITITATWVVHKAAEGSHNCAYCGEKVTDCVSNDDDGDCTTAITCSVCGEETTAANAAHTDTNTDGKCDACAKDMPTTPGTDEPGTDDPNTGNTDEPKDDEGGLGTGAIVAIVVGSVLVVGIGGFALVWFVIKKKTWADFLAIFKKG